MYKMKITFWHTLYKRECTYNVCGNITFKDGRAVFNSGGHGVAIESEYIISIEPLED